VSERTLQVKPEGLQAFRRYAQALAEAESRGEDVPALQDLDAVVDWLDERDLIVAPVPSREHARLLIEMCAKGGTTTVLRRA
jgi:hypothetical protein